MLPERERVHIFKNSSLFRSGAVVHDGIPVRALNPNGRICTDKLSVVDVVLQHDDQYTTGQYCLVIGHVEST